MVALVVMKSIRRYLATSVSPVLQLPCSSCGLWRTSFSVAYFDIDLPIVNKTNTPRLALSFQAQLASINVPSLPCNPPGLLFSIVPAIPKGKLIDLHARLVSYFFYSLFFSLLEIHQL